MNYRMYFHLYQGEIIKTLKNRHIIQVQFSFLFTFTIIFEIYFIFIQHGVLFVFAFYNVL